MVNVNCVLKLEVLVYPKLNALFMISNYCVRLLKNPYCASANKHKIVRGDKRIGTVGICLFVCQYSLTPTSIARPDTENNQRTDMCVVDMIDNRS